MINVDLSKAGSDELDIPSYNRQSFLDRIGFSLALFVLGLMLVYIVFLGFFFNSSDINAANIVKNNPELLKSGNEGLLAIVSQQTTETREFVSEVSKTILINMLLPILTAILGFVFGSNERN